MKDKLTLLKNTMGLIETKGESTRIMAQCLSFTEQLIKECEEAENNCEE